MFNPFATLLGVSLQNPEKEKIVRKGGKRKFDFVIIVEIEGF